MAILEDPATSREQLRERNLRIGEAERVHDLAFLASALREDLVFRRADGRVVGRSEYLEAVRGRTYEILRSEVLALEVSAESAVATVMVRAAGAGPAGPFAGSYRNTRMFVREDGGWRCAVWLNARAGLDVATLHHVSIPVADVERSRRFYGEVLGLREIPRPPFGFPGAWYQVGAGQLHLIEDEGARATFRGGKPLDARDIHFAIRVRSYREALESLLASGYRADAPPGDPLELRSDPRPTAGFPQIYVLDPDRNVVEINAERLDPE